MTYIDKSPKLDNADKKFIQQGVGSFFYYGRAIDNPILVTLNEIGTQQSKPTENTKKRMKWLLVYTATYSNPKLRFCASDMVLHIDSDATYLVLPNSKSPYAGIFIFLIHHQHTEIQIQSSTHQFISIVKSFAASYVQVQNVKQEEYF